MGTYIGKFVLSIAGSQENSCLMSSIYSKKKKTRSSAGRSNRDRSEFYQEEKMCKRCEE